jgi:hypothetical protein
MGPRYSGKRNMENTERGYNYRQEVGSCAATMSITRAIGQLYASDLVRNEKKL